MGDSFEAIWRRIVAHAGEQFQLRTGQVFRYEVVEGDRLRPTLSEASVTRAEVQHCYAQVDGEGSGKIALLSSGPSFIWSILTDRRICGE